MSLDTRRPDTARPHFHIMAVQNMALSEKEGRPIFEDKEMVKITIPGDKNLNWIGPVEEEHKMRWPDHYAAFKRGEQRAATGTPLEHWPNPNMTAARVAELKAQNIFSVDEYAAVSDSVLPRLGINARRERDEALAYVEAARGGAATTSQAAEISRLREMVERLQSIVSGGAPVEAEPVKAEKTLEDCTDAELKEFIKRETGEAVRGNPSRETLTRRAAEIAKEREAA